jgi:hypothetical protein
MARGFVFVVIIAVAYVLLSQAGVFNVSTASSASYRATPQLPAAQRTAIAAPAVATRNAGEMSAQVADAQAQAQEDDAARVYMQAVADEQNKRVAVATQQSVMATQVSNDVNVSKGYATLAAVSLQATSEAISRTIATDREQYAANVAVIQATRQANAVAMINKADSDSATKQRDYFLTWVPFAVCLPTIVIVILIALYALLQAARRIGPTASQKEINDLRDEIDDLRSRQSDDDDDPEPEPDAADVDKILKLRAGRNAAIRYVADSIREKGGKATKLLTATEWEGLPNGAPRETHTAAVGYLREELSAIYTQQGGPADEQGTRVKQDVGDLASLAVLIATTPLP